MVRSLGLGNANLTPGTNENTRLLLNFHIVPLRKLLLSLGLAWKPGTVLVPLKFARQLVLKTTLKRTVKETLVSMHRNALLRAVPLPH
jgi:hypothetical protein